MSEVLKFSNSAQCAVLLISPCFNISAYPEKKLCASSVRKNSVSINTLFAGANEPISFFSPLKLIPVLPPTEASTIASKVVGIDVRNTAFESGGGKTSQIGYHSSTKVDEQ